MLLFNDMTVEQYVEKMLQGMISKGPAKHTEKPVEKPSEKPVEDKPNDKPKEVATDKQNDSEPVKSEEETPAEGTLAGCYCSQLILLVIIATHRPPSKVTNDALLSAKDKLKPTEVCTVIACCIVYYSLTDSRTSHSCGWY